MTIIQKFDDLFKKKMKKLQFAPIQKLKDFSQNYFLISSLIFLLTVIFFIFGNLAKNRNLENVNNLKSSISSTEFSNLSNYLLSKIDSPYKEEKYLIKKNDSIERILKKFKIKNEDINGIASELKEKSYQYIFWKKIITNYQRA